MASSSELLMKKGCVFLLTTSLQFQLISTGSSSLNTHSSSLCLFHSPPPALSLSPSLCLSPDWDLQSSRLTSSGRRSRQAPQPPPTHTHTHIHKHTHSLTRHVRHEASEMRAKREICCKREEERQCAYICVCSVMH